MEIGQKTSGILNEDLSVFHIVVSRMCNATIAVFPWQRLQQL
jgi:hypothetical protein